MEDVKNEINKSITRILKKYGLKQVSKMITILKSEGKDDSNFIKKMKVNVEYFDDIYRLTLSLPDYWVFIENGRKPNSKMPPKAPILKWQKRKNIPEKFNYIIRKNIGIRGIKPIHFIDVWYDTIFELNKIMADNIQENIENDIKEYIKNNI